MATYFTADTHFGHYNIIKHCNRPFESLQDMNESLIINWNARVHKNDHVYIAGDLAWRGGYENALAIIKRLKGFKHLAIGNHDKDFLRHQEYRELFVEIDNTLFLNNNDGHTTICHYPMLSWSGSRRGAWHIYGHMHNNIEKDDFIFSALFKMEKALNAGVDICGYMPVTFDELIAYNRVFKSSNCTE